MPSPKKDETSDAPKQKVVRRSHDTPIADTAKAQNRGKGENVSLASDSRTPPPNARVVKPSYKTGTVSRAAVRAAIERVLSRS